MHEHVGRRPLCCLGRSMIYVQDGPLFGTQRILPRQTTNTPMSIYRMHVSATKDLTSVPLLFISRLPLGISIRWGGFLLVNGKWSNSAGWRSFVHKRCGDVWLARRRASPGCGDGCLSTRCPVGSMPMAEEVQKNNEGHPTSAPYHSRYYDRPRC